MLQLGAAELLQGVAIDGWLRECLEPGLLVLVRGALLCQGCLQVSLLTLEGWESLLYPGLLVPERGQILPQARQIA